MDDFNDYPTLSQSFDNILKSWEDIENSDQPTSSEAIQCRIKEAISELENLTVKVSYLGVFSSNESLQDIPSTSLKFLLLPLLLGLLHIKRCDDKTEDRLKIASVYLRDFLKRCKSYGLTNMSLKDETFDDDDDDELPKVERQVSSSKTSIEDLRAMALAREEKIKMFRAKKEMEDKLTKLRSVVDYCHDDEVLRDYFITLINHFIYRSVEELDCISKEISLLREMRKMPPSEKEGINRPPTSTPLRTFHITKESVKQNVFGAGYPSLPLLSVEEFYNQKVQEGWFPSPLMASPSTGTVKSSRGDEEKPEEAPGETLTREQLTERDEWRDTHRTGWGNTYNRS